MDRKVAETIKSIQPITFRQLLENHQRRWKYDDYEANAHNSGGFINMDELDEFLEMVREDWCKAKNIPYEKFPSREQLHDHIMERISDESIDFQQGNSVAQGHMNFVHVMTHKNQSGSPKIDLRLYLNLKRDNIVKFSKIFYKTCRERNMLPYFKFSNTDNKRNDTFLIYTNYEDMQTYIDIINEIKANNPELLEGTEKPNPNMGTIEGYIGYGEEPVKHGESYNSTRRKACDDMFKKIEGSARSVVAPKMKTNLGIIWKTHYSNKSVFGDRDFVLKAIDSFVNRFYAGLKSNKAKIPAKVQEYMQRMGEGFVKSEIASQVTNQLEGFLISNVKTEEIKISIGFPGVPASELYTASYKVDDFIKGMRKIIESNPSGKSETSKKVPDQDYSRFLTYNLYGDSWNVGGFKKYKELLVNEAKAKLQNIKGVDVNDEKFINQLLIAFIHHKPYYVYDEQGRRLDVTQLFNRMAIYEGVVGKDTIDKIIETKADELKIDKDNVSINSTTRPLLEDALAGSEKIEPTVKEEPVAKAEPEPTVKKEPVAKVEPEPTVKEEPVAKAEPEPTVKKEPVVEAEPEPAVKEEPAEAADSHEDENFKNIMIKFAQVHASYYDGKKGTRGHAHTKEEISLKNKINRSMRKYLRGQTEKLAMESNLDQDELFSQLSNAVSPDLITQLVDNKGATIKLMEIMASGVYVKNGERIRLTQKQRIALAETMTKVSEQILQREIKTTGRNGKIVANNPTNESERG